MINAITLAVTATLFPLITLYACSRSLSKLTMFGFATLGNPLRLPAIITSSMICTNPTRSSTSVELAGVPLVSCVSAYDPVLTTDTSITTSPTTCPSLLNAAAVAAC